MLGVVARLAREFVDARGTVRDPLGAQYLLGEIGLQRRPKSCAEQRLLHRQAEGGVDADGVE